METVFVAVGLKLEQTSISSEVNSCFC